MATDLEKAFTALDAKSIAYKVLWNYYDGDHPLVYSAERLKELFRNMDARFSENWCAVVVDSVADRLDLKRFLVTGNKEATALLNKEWERTEMSLDSDDAHLDALVTGEAFVISWRDEKGELETYYNDARLCHIQYDPERPRRKLWAAKWWATEDETWRLTLYYPDRLEYYRTTQKGAPSSAKQFQPLEGDAATATNPFNEIPVFHVRLRRRTVQGELTQSVRELQNAVNKLLADMMVAAEFGSFRQRWVISNAEIGSLKNAPNEIWDLPAGDGVGQDTQVGEFTETRLDNFLGAMDKLAASIGIISRTPKHFFVKLPTHEVSGEALLALEAPLNKKCARYIEHFTPTWRRIAAFMLKVSGIDVDPLAITPLFDRPETVQPRTQAEIRQMNAQAGVPLVTTLRDEGKSEFYIEQMLKDRRQQELAGADLAKAYLEQARRQMDQEEGGNA